MIRLIRNPVFLYFVSNSSNLTRIQTHRLRIGHLILIKYKYLRLYDKENENERKTHTQKTNNGSVKIVDIYTAAGPAYESGYIHCCRACI